MANFRAFDEMDSLPHELLGHPPAELSGPPPTGSSTGHSLPELSTAHQPPPMGPHADEKLGDTLPDRLKLLNGFPRTARFLAADPTNSLLIVRRFDEVATRDLLLLEGRVAALEAVQKKLDREDYAVYRANDVFTRSAGSWEQFALLGSSGNEETRIPEAAFDLWCTHRIVDLNAKVQENKHLPPDLREENYAQMQSCLRRQQILQVEIEKCEQELQSISDLSSKNLDSYDVERWSKDRDRRSKSLARRRTLLTERRYWLGYDEKLTLKVKQRWEVSEALRIALQEYQEAVLRYAKMLKLEEPADRSANVVTQWVLGKIRTKPGTQQPSRQFVPGTAMDHVYPEVQLPEPSFSTRFFSRRGPRVLKKPLIQPSIQDRVSVGRAASADRLSRWISRFDFILKWGKASSFEYTELNYIPETFLNRVVTFCVLILSANLVFGAIWFLWLAQIKQSHQSVQLALLTIFIVAFGFALTFMTTAKREQVFGATAAYAAVLVVFVGSSTNGPSGVGQRMANVTTQALIPS